MRGQECSRLVPSEADCTAVIHPHEGSGEAHQPTFSAGSTCHPSP